MSQPTVCAVMLVDGRQEMTRRAIASFRAQTYERKRLLIWDTGKKPGVRLNDFSDPNIWYDRSSPQSTIGAMRNDANRIACYAGPLSADLIAYFDSDDWSHPCRLAEQVALLEASGKACVGYREVLFWDTRIVQIEVDPSRTGPDGTGVLGVVKSVGEAWIYRNPDPRWVCGASMMYRREAWEACPFDDAPGEDQLWWLKNAEKCLGDVMPHPMLADPRMICGIHGQNTEAYRRHDSALGKGDGMLSGGNGVWFRAPEWDEYAGRTMLL